MLTGRGHRDTEIGAAEVSLIVRSIPLRRGADHLGAVVLVRDVTDLRRRDRELVTKDATIREIHHRVKNNLQTVAALLRLQARRIGEPAARLGARGGGPPGGVDRHRARDAEPVGRGDRRLRRGRGPPGGDGHRRELGGGAGPGPPGRVVRPARLRGGQRAGDGAHRGAPERRRARLPGGRPAGRHRSRGGDRDDRPPGRGPAAPDHRRRRGRAPGGLRQRPVDEPGALDRADPGGVRARRAAHPRPRGGRPGDPGRRRRTARTDLEGLGGLRRRSAPGCGRCGA